MPLPVFVGVDVSLRSLSVALVDEQRQARALATFANSSGGRRKLVRRLLRLGSAVHVCLEPTSVYHLALAFLLDETPELRVSVVNPRAVRDFGRSLMLRGKTDPGDAVILALYGAANQPPDWQPPSAAALELRMLCRRRADLIERQTAVKNQLHAAQQSGLSALVLRDLKQELRQLAARIAQLHYAARQQISQDQQLEQRFRLLVSVPGIGEISAVRIVGELSVVPPGLGKKQWLALAGLDPVPQDSGKHHGRRRISKQGNAHLRQALLFPALTAKRCCPQVRDYCERLQHRCRCTNMQAVCAVMRKLLQAIWGMFNTNTTFNPSLFFHPQP